MVNKKLLLGLIFIGGLQGLQCMEQVNTPLKAIEKDFFPEDYGDYLENLGEFERYISLVNNPKATISDLKEAIKALLGALSDEYRSAAAIQAGDDAALIHERNINQKLQEELDRLRQEIDVLKMEITSLQDTQNHSPMNPFTEENLEWDDSDLSLKEKSVREFELEEKLKAFRKASDEQISILVERALKAEIEIQKLQHQNATLQSKIARTQNVPGNMIPGSDDSSSDDDGDSSDNDDTKTTREQRPVLNLNITRHQ